MTRKRDFVDFCVWRESAGLLLGTGRYRSLLPGSAWADDREAWETAEDGRRVTVWALLGILSQICFLLFLIL